MVLHSKVNAGCFQKTFGGVLTYYKSSLTKEVLCLGNAVTFYCQALTIIFHKWA